MATSSVADSGTLCFNTGGAHRRAAFANAITGTGSVADPRQRSGAPLPYAVSLTSTRQYVLGRDEHPGLRWQSSLAGYSYGSGADHDQQQRAFWLATCSTSYRQLTHRWARERGKPTALTGPCGSRAARSPATSPSGALDVTSPWRRARSRARHLQRRDHYDHRRRHDHVGQYQQQLHGRDLVHRQRHAGLGQSQRARVQRPLTLPAGPTLGLTPTATAGARPTWRARIPTR